MIDRDELIAHLDWVVRPPLAWWFIDQIEHAIELAAAGRMDERIEVDLRRMTAAEAVAIWELEELVERAREQPPNPS